MICVCHMQNKNNKYEKECHDLSELNVYLLMDVCFGYFKLCVSLVL